MGKSDLSAFVLQEAVGAEKAESFVLGKEVATQQSSGPTKVIEDHRYGTKQVVQMGHLAAGETPKEFQEVPESLATSDVTIQAQREAASAVFTSPLQGVSKNAWYRRQLE